MPLYNINHVCNNCSFPWIFEVIFLLTSNLLVAYFWLSRQTWAIISLQKWFAFSSLLYCVLVSYHLPGHWSAKIHNCCFCDITKMCLPSFAYLLTVKLLLFFMPCQTCHRPLCLTPVLCACLGVVFSV